MSSEVHEGSGSPDVRSSGTEPLAWVTSDGVVHLDVSWLVPPDLRVVDALARLHVAASGCGRRLQLHGPNGGLAELLEFVGLGDVVRLCPCCRSSVRPRRPTLHEPPS